MLNRVEKMYAEGSFLIFYPKSKYAKYSSCEGGGRENDENQINNSEKGLKMHLFGL